MLRVLQRIDPTSGSSMPQSPAQAPPSKQSPTTDDRGSCASGSHSAGSAFSRAQAMDSGGDSAAGGHPPSGRDRSKERRSLVVALEIFILRD